MFRLHLGRGAEIVVAADDMQRGERDAANRPAPVFAEFGVLRIAGLALHRDGALAEALALRIEQPADLGERVERVDLARLQMHAIRPVVVARCQDETDAARFGTVSCKGFVVFVSTRHRSCRRRPIVEAWVGLDVTDVDHKREVAAIDRSQEPRELLLLYLAVGHVADQRELEARALARASSPPASVRSAARPIWSSACPVRGDAGLLADRAHVGMVTR